MLISEKDKLDIKNLIKAVENKTQSEIVPMIVDASDNYPAAHFRAAIIVSFLFSLGLYFSPLSIINPIYFLWIQIPGLFLGYLLAKTPGVKKRLITRAEIEEEVSQKGYEAFFQNNLHVTKGHNGILILVSLMEQKIKIIADQGISKKVEQVTWDKMIFEFSEHIKNGYFVLGLKNCIETAGKVLEKVAPLTSEKTENELENELILETFDR